MNSVDEWRYSHEALNIQLGTQGVRQFELDLNYDFFEEEFRVFHFLRADDESTCDRFVECLQIMKSWSEKNPAHFPFMVLLELKDSGDIENASLYFSKVEEELLSVWPTEQLITPDLVRGNFSTIREAITNTGWPTLNEVRGKALFVILNGGEFSQEYIKNDPSLQGRPLFVRAPSTAEYAAVLLHDDPVGNEEKIRSAVEQGFIVRTRIDEVTESGPQIISQRLNAALESGAHFLSTDRPSELMLPMGSPSRCNPINGPTECSSNALENPTFIVISEGSAPPH